jgi:tight adherence protein B
MTLRLAPLIVAVLACLAGSAAAGVAQEATESEGVTVDVREVGLEGDGAVRMVVSVTGDAVDGILDAAAFRVEENGEEIPDLSVTPLLETLTQPIAVAVLVDISGSTADKLDETKVAVADFATELLGQPGIQMLLVEFDEAARVVQPLTADADAFASSVASLEVGGDTAIYDAVVLAADRLRPLGLQSDIVVFSDGNDESSTATLDDAVAAANGIGAGITTVIVTSESLDTTALQALSSGTGGRSIEVDSAAALAGAFDTVVDQIASQYVIEYTGSINDTDELDIALTVSAGDETLEDVFTVANTRDPDPVAPRILPQVEVPAVARGTTGLLVGAGAAFLALASLFTLLVTSPRSRASKLLDRELDRYISGSTGRSDPTLVATALRRRALDLIESAPTPRGFDERMQARLEQANWPLRTGEFLGIVLLATAFGLIVGWTLAAWFVGLALAIVLGTAPFILLNLRRSKRTREFLERLPDLLQLLAGSLAAGYGIVQALDMTAKEAGEPVKHELNRAITETRLGMPLEEALHGVADRIDSEDFRWVVLAINIQREVGGNLAALLNTVAETLREREMLRRQIRVLSAEGKLSAYVLIALPIFLAGWLTLTRREYVGVLTQSTMGWAAIWGGLFLMIVGVFWIRNLIRIEV